jgi:hypothetical protein
MKPSAKKVARSEGIRQSRRDYVDREPALNEKKPKGPFKKTRKAQAGDMLIFVPRDAKSAAIDKLTGGYGYSHLALDTGEIDEPTRRTVMVESTMDDVVHYAFQDEYGDRPFVRVPLQQAGVDPKAFCACVLKMLGEKFDDEAALTLGILDNPARQICSDLATNCLPEEMRGDLARAHRAAEIHPLSGVLHDRAATDLRLFISPNGFAEYFGAPRGKKLKGPDQAADPHPPRERKPPGGVSRFWRRSTALLSTGVRQLRDR